MKFTASVPTGPLGDRKWTFLFACRQAETELKIPSSDELVQIQANRYWQESIDKAIQSNRRGEMKTPLQLAAESGEDATLQVLLKYGADVNSCYSAHLWESLSHPLLHLAIQRNNHSLVSILRLLSVKGIEVNAKALNSNGHTALHIAVKGGKSDVLEILLDHGADINVVNKGETALIMGVTCSPWEKYEQVIRMLVERGADIEMINEDGNTAVMVAAQHSSQPLGAIKLLVERGADTSTRNSKGLTALMMAADCGNFLVVEYLLQRRMNQYIEEDEVWSAVVSATKNGHVETARVLLETLRKIAVKDHRYRSSAALVLELSKVNANSDMIFLLEEYEQLLSLIPHEVSDQNAGGVESHQDDQEIFYTVQNFQADSDSQAYGSFQDDGHFYVEDSSQMEDIFQHDGDFQLEKASGIGEEDEDDKARRTTPVAHQNYL